MLLLVCIATAMSCSAPPLTEDRAVQLLLDSRLMAKDGLLLTSELSYCRIDGPTEIVMADGLHTAFKQANESGNTPLDLNNFRTRHERLDHSKSARQWFYERGKPVISISRFGIVENDAVVCVHMHTDIERAIFVYLKRKAGDEWEITSQELAWESPKEE